MNTVVGIDLGTQSLKVVFYDFQRRRIVAHQSSGLDLDQREDGAAEQNARDWVDALGAVMHTIDPALRSTVRAIGVSGQQHGFVPLDNAGEVLAPVKLWCDTTTQIECDEIMGRFGGRQACIDRVGNPILPGYTAPKVAWLKRHRPEVYDALDCILLPHDYLNFVLSGRLCMEAGDASGTGFFDIRERSWSPEMLAAVDPERDLMACLPAIVDAHGVIGELQAQAASWLGLPAGVPISSGGGDNMMGAIGTGCVDVGAVTMSLGTSGTVFAFSDRPIVDPEGKLAAFCSSTGGWLPLVCTMNCTVTTELLRGLMEAELPEFETLVSNAPRGSDGVLTLPFFNGERTPSLPRAKGCILGLDPRNSRRENLLRSGIEGATFALRQGLEGLRNLGVRADEIMLTGGGSASPTWRQVVADVCRAPVVVFRQDEGASFGAALQALWALEGGGADLLNTIVATHLTRDDDKCCTPDPDAASLYDECMDRYQRAVTSIAELYR